MRISFVPPFVRAVRLAMGRPEGSGQSSLLWLMTAACEEGLPLDSAVQAMADDAGGLWSHRLQDFASLLRRGVPMQEAVRMVPDLLPDESLLAVQVGAASGQLAPALRAEAERQSEIVSSPGSGVAEILLYVSGLLVVLGLVSSFMLVYIVPKMKKIFDDFDTELPQLTQQLVSAADNPLGVPLVGSIVLFCTLASFSYVLFAVGFRRRLRALDVRHYFPRLDIGPVLQQLGIVVSSGGSAFEGLRVLSTQHPHRATWKRLSAVYEAVNAGEDCWAMMRLHRLLRPAERQLLETAERAGNLGLVLQLLGRQIEARQDHALRLAIELIRPVAVVLISILVGGVAIGMFLPLVKLLADLT